VTIEALSEYRFPLDSMVLCSLRVRLDVIATRFDLPIYEWEEDGLGRARGLGCRLPSGLVFVLRELEHAVRHLGAAGPGVDVDVGVVATRGVASLVDEITNALQLSSAEVDWVEVAEAEEWAKQHAEFARQYLEARRQRNQGAAEPSVAADAEPE
jgi:hypothetical protein